MLTGERLRLERPRLKVLVEPAAEAAGHRHLVFMVEPEVPQDCLLTIFLLQSEVNSSLRLMVF